MKPLILIIEDETAIRNLLKYSFETQNFSTVLCDDATPALKELQHRKPDLILLDWMLPSMSGIDFIRKIKKIKHSQYIPIIMLTAKAEEEHKIKGLETGADDYITKPFSPKELIARVKTVLRRGIIVSPSNEIQIGELQINLNKQSVSKNKELLNLTPNSFRLLRFLTMHPNRAFSRAELLDQVWGYNKELDERSVDAEIKRLRKAIGTTSKHIKAVRGVGYQLDTELNHE